MSTVQDEKPLLVNGDHSDRFGQFWQGGARAWEYAGQGTETRLDSATLSQQDPAVEEFDQVPGGRCSDSQNSKKKEHKTKLNQFQATSIAGNDITSSCLYVSGIAASMGEKWAPVSLTLVALLLFFFRSVYAEVGTALPLNGLASFDPRWIIQCPAQQYDQVVCLLGGLPDPGLLHRHCCRQRHLCHCLWRLHVGP